MVQLCLESLQCLSIAWQEEKKIEEQIMHIKELCEHMEIQITGSDLTERDRFPTCILPLVWLKLKRL